MPEQRANTGELASSTGHALAEARYLDDHYESFRTEYEAMLRSVGLQTGWHVLDAACGGGSFLPLMSDLIGPTGRITALDIAPENVRFAEERIASGLHCPATTDRGDVMALPYPDDQFDAVWCANTTMYLTDDALVTALAELLRVVRPGGIVALKDPESGHYMIAPAAAPFSHLTEANAAVSVPARGASRSHMLRRWLERAGLEAVRQRTTLMERWAPLRTVERQYIADWITAGALAAEGLDLPDAERAFWQTQCDATQAAHCVNHPEFYYCGDNVVAVGRVPALANP